MVFPLQEALQLILTYKYAIIFPIAVIEGPIISILGGFLASGGYVNVYIVYGLLILADLVGDTLYYALGRFGGNYFLKRWGWIFRIDDSKLLRLESAFKNHGGKLLFFSKTQGIGSAILAAAGVTKMPYGRFMWINLIATLIKSFVLVMVGFYFGKAYTSINDYLNKIALVSLFMIIAIGIFIFLRRQKNV